VIEFTTFARAGLLMGVWGMAAELGQAGGGLMGGVVVDVMRRVSGGDALLAYGTVFAIESALLVIALALTSGLRVDLAARGTLKASARLAAEELTPAAW
jgi:MFS transporter, BCD family, chlorophyll transporter